MGKDSEENIKSSHLKIDLERFNKCIVERGGELLSEFLGYNKKHLVKCANGHMFYIDPVHVIYHNNWCRDCSGNLKSERLCRQIFEKIYNNYFIKSRPDFLKPLELDGYCKELNIAFEYNGNYHYERTKFSHNLSIIQERDSRKKQLCESNGVKLFIIPYFPEYLTIKKAIQHIINIINIDIDIVEIEKQIDLKYVFSNKISDDVRNLISDKGGQLLSEYGLSRDKVICRCKDGHEWSTTIHNIKYGFWCPHCANNIKFSIDKVIEIGDSFGFELISTEYKNNITPLIWRCKNGHIFNRTLSNMKKIKTRCPKCK